MLKWFNDPESLAEFNKTLQLLLNDQSIFRYVYYSLKQGMRLSEIQKDAFLVLVRRYSVKTPNIFPEGVEDLQWEKKA